MPKNSNSKKACRYTEIGTNFFSDIARNLPLLKTVAYLSPFLLSAFARKQQEIISAYEREFSGSVHAINLCLTFRGWQYYSVTIDDEVYLSVIDYFK